MPGTIRSPFLCLALLTSSAWAAPAPQRFIDRLPAPTDAAVATVCIANADQLSAEIENLAIETALAGQHYATQGMGDMSKMTPAASDAMGQLMTEPYQTCATTMPTEVALRVGPLQGALDAKVEALRAERDRICAAQPNQGEGGCDPSAANRAVRPKAIAAGSAYYASAAPLLAKFKAEAGACIAKREAVVETLLPVGGMMAMQATTARGMDYGVAGVWVGVVQGLCRAAEDAKAPFAD